MSAAWHSRWEPGPPRELISLPTHSRVPAAKRRTQKIKLHRLGKLVPSSQVPQPTCFWKWVGRTNPQKSNISTLEVCFSVKKILHQKAQWNWNQSSMTFKFCQFETILKVSSGHCGPLTPFLQFRQLLLQSGQIYWVTFFNWISPGAANHISPALFLA